MYARPSLRLCMIGLLLTAVVLLSVVHAGGGKKYKNKYSAEANHDGRVEPHHRHKNSAESNESAFDSIESDELPNGKPERPPPETYDPDFRKLHKPFRMSKLNMVWSKAQQRLTEPKLKSLYTELKIHDKEELAWKQLNGQHHDKDGLKEAALREKLLTTMSVFNLLEHFDDTAAPEKYKHHKNQHAEYDATSAKASKQHTRLFKDKKLNRLWEKAEVSGFTAEELVALREEFQHHQQKVDTYFAVLEDSVMRRKDERHENAVNEDEFDRINLIQHAEEPDVAAQQSVDVATAAAAAAGNNKRNEYLDEANLLRDKHRDLRDNYERLERIAAKAPDSQEFIEPKVQNLWRVAAAGNFSDAELASLRVELMHYESRLLKLRHLHAEQALSREKYKDASAHNSKYAGTDEHIQKQLRKVEQMQVQLEERIFLHNEL